jgi:hypothetical protein
MRPTRATLARQILYIGLLTLGIFFIIRQPSILFLPRNSWPLYIVLFGLAFFAGMLVGGRRSGALAIPASMFTVIGLLLAYLSISGRWESLIYIWPLIVPMSLGLGLVLWGLWGRDSGLRWAGAIVAASGVTVAWLAWLRPALIPILLGVFVAGWLCALVLFGVVVLLIMAGRRKGWSISATVRTVLKPTLRPGAKRAELSMSR